MPCPTAWRAEPCIVNVYCCCCQPKLASRVAALAPQTLRDEVDLAAAIARRLRLAHVHLFELLLHRPLELRESTTLERFDDQIAAGLQPLRGKFERQLAQMHGARLIGGLDTGEIGGQIRNHKVELAPVERRLDRGVPFGLPEVAADEYHAANRVHRQQVDGDDAPARAQLLVQHLRPASRRRSQVDDAHARPEQPVLLRELQQLERRARAVAQPGRFLDPVVVDVLLHPRLDELVLLRCLRSRHRPPSCARLVDRFTLTPEPRSRVGRGPARFTLAA